MTGKKLKITSINELGSFEKIMSTTSDDLRKIAEDLRALVAEVMPGVTEVAWERQRTTSYGVGPKKMSEHFCYIAPQKKHVNLGFYYGAELKGGAGLLEGEGKLLRHIKIRSRDEIAKPVLKKILKEASGYLPRLK